MRVLRTGELHCCCIPEIYYVGRLQDENLRETFQEQLNAKLDSLNFNSVEYGWNNFRKTICEVADGVLGKKAKSSFRNISEKALCLIDRRKGFCKNFVKNISYENKRI